MGQPELEGTGHGNVVMAYGSDGSKWYAIHLDSEGDPQVDILTIPYPGLGDLVSVKRSGALASSAGWTTLLDVTGPGILEALDFASNYNASDWRITVDGEVLSIPSAQGGSNFSIMPSRLNSLNGESAFFQEGVYDAVTDAYSIYLKRAIHYKTTLKVEYRQQSGVSKDVALACYYRPLA